MLAQGASWADSPAELAEHADVVITCLPSPAASAEVMEGERGVLRSMRPGTAWLEMSTTDEAEVKRLGAVVEAKGGRAADCPVSGGCHRAASGNISILAGCERDIDVAERGQILVELIKRVLIGLGPVRHFPDASGRP